MAEGLRSPVGPEKDGEAVGLDVCKVDQEAPREVHQPRVDVALCLCLVRLPRQRQAPAYGRGSHAHEDDVKVVEHPDVRR